MLSEEEKEKIRQEIREDLEQREQRDAEEIKRRAMERAGGGETVEPIDEQQLAEAEIQRLKQEEEDRFYRENPNYVQYVDRYGQKRWIHRKLFEEKRRKSLERSRAKRQARWSEIRKYSLYVGAVVAVLAAIWIYRITRPSPVLIVRCNVPNASIFIDNLLSRHVTDATIRKISPGKHKIAVYKAGYDTKFVRVDIGKTDSTFIEVELDSLPPTDLAIRSGHAGDIADLKPVEVPRRKTIPTTTPRTRKSASSAREFASVFITSNEPDATIYLDGDPIAAEINSVIENVEIGAHTFEVRKSGYRSDPSYSLVHLRKPGELVSLSFELVRDIPTSLTIKTEPVSGEIFLDGRSLTRGMYQEEVPIGEYKVSFGEVPGYHTPASKDIFITEIHPTMEVIGIYIPNIYIEASLGDDGQLIRRSCQDVTVGYYLVDQGAVESFEYGPTIEKIKSQGMYYWELGYAFSRRNPPGSDFIEMRFELPPHFDDNERVVLELHGYGSRDNYLFHLSEVNDIAIDINNKEVFPHIQPSSILGNGQPIGVDSWPILMHLQEGGNSVRIRTTEENHCYYYLRRIIIRST